MSHYAARSPYTAGGGVGNLHNFVRAQSMALERPLTGVIGWFFVSFLLTAGQCVWL